MSRRCTNYATIIYEESQIDGWEQILNDLHIPALVSPLHDRDELPDKSGYKKSHWHCILMWGSLKSLEQAREVMKQIGGVGCEPIHSLKSYAAYLIHLYDLDKAQYDITEVKEYSGANYHSLIKESSDKYTMISEVIRFCQNNEIISFAQLMEFALDNLPSMFMTLCDYPWPIINYLKSKTWERDKGYDKKTPKLERESTNTGDK